MSPESVPPFRKSTERDDRVLPATRWVSLTFSIILVLAVAVLWGTPDRTADRWAWTIEPELTAIFMGSVYAAGAFFFARLFFGRRFHPAAAGLLGAIAVTSLILITTLVYWERFNHGDAPFAGAVSFYGWVAIYAFAPALLTVLLLRNRRTDPGRPEAPDTEVPRPVRRATQVVAALSAAGATFLLLLPGAAIDVWLWELTPLTSRLLGCYVATVATALFGLAADPRWSAWRFVIQASLIFAVFLLVGTLRAWADLDEDNALTWAYLGSILGGLVALTALYGTQERRSRTART
jgi:hypothetical protein